MRSGAEFSDLIRLSEDGWEPFEPEALRFSTPDEGKVETPPLLARSDGERRGLTTTPPEEGDFSPVALEGFLVIREGEPAPETAGLLLNCRIGEDEEMRPEATF